MKIISQTGSGYFDSLTGLIFFLLIGRWVQNRTHQFLSFERDFQILFPSIHNPTAGGAGRTGFIH
jgi:Cu+-exporting ATPase